MIAGKLVRGSQAEGAAAGPGAGLRPLAQRLPRSLRFLAVGALGLGADHILFTIMLMQAVHPLVAGFLALVAATVLTWRLNRAFTFERSGRRQREEALRYAVVTAVAQSTSYAVFALLVSTTLAALPQGAVVGCKRRARKLYGKTRRQLGPHTRVDGENFTASALIIPCAAAALSRLPHCSADGEQARPVSRQLDLCA